MKRRIPRCFSSVHMHSWGRHQAKDFKQIIGNGHDKLRVKAESRCDGSYVTDTT